jgi:hydrogenase expression/formation protein HypC
MCLTVPAKVLAVDGAKALVDSRGRQREVDASFVSPAVGDYVLMISGVIVQRLDPEEAQEALRAWAEVEAATRA